MFEFGFMFWILFFVIFFGCGRMCGWGARRYMDRKRGLEEGLPDEEVYRVGGPRSRAALGDDAAQGGTLRDAMFRRSQEGDREPARLRKGSPLKQLQKKFIDGGLTLEEYERELDSLERLD